MKTLATLSKTLLLARVLVVVGVIMSGLFLFSGKAAAQSCSEITIGFGQQLSGYATEAECLANWKTCKSDSECASGQCEQQSLPGGSYSVCVPVQKATSGMACDFPVDCASHNCVNNKCVGETPAASLPMLPNCNQVCENPFGGCNCPLQCVANSVGNGINCGGINDAANSGQKSYLASCTAVCKDADGCLCAVGCVQSETGLNGYCGGVGAAPNNPDNPSNPPSTDCVGTSSQLTCSEGVYWRCVEGDWYEVSGSSCQSNDAGTRDNGSACSPAGSNAKCASGWCDGFSGTCKPNPNSGSGDNQTTLSSCTAVCTDQDGCHCPDGCNRGITEPGNTCGGNRGTGGVTPGGGGNGAACTEGKVPSDCQAGLYCVNGTCVDNAFGSCEDDGVCEAGDGECIAVHTCDELDPVTGECTVLTPEVSGSGSSKDAQALANEKCKCVQVDVLNGENGSCVNGHINGDMSTLIGAKTACPDETANCSNTPNSPPPGGSTPPGSNPPGSNPPSSHEPGPQCLNISRSIENPQIGDQVSFTCGQVAGAQRYIFKVTAPDGKRGTLSATGRVSEPLNIDQAGKYYAQCQICTGNADSTCHRFESLPN